MEVSSNIPGIATHSGWVELGLIFSVLLLVFVEAARHAYSARMAVLGFVVLIACLYSVGEVAIHHDIEILFYLLALAPALLLKKPGQIGAND